MLQKRMKNSVALLAVLMLLASGCLSNESPALGNPPLAFAVTGLPVLGEDFLYEGWVVFSGDRDPASTGRFTIDEVGNFVYQTTPVIQGLENAITVILTIEPVDDDDPGPTVQRVLAGDVVGQDAILTIDHPAALATDFSEASGVYTLASPTSSSNDDELSGVWFMSINPIKSGLDLPDLPEGWVYEGWAVIDGTPLSTGRFRDVNAADDSALFSALDKPGPPFPGEDFVINAPNGLDFPADISGQIVAISVEPEPDDSPAPFPVTPLFAMVPNDVVDLERLDLGMGGPPTPTGSVRLPVLATSSSAVADAGAGSPTINFVFDALPPLGADSVYEGWVVYPDDRAPASTGRFTVDADGQMSYENAPAVADLGDAVTVVITLEPFVDLDPAPTAQRILAGDVVGNRVRLSVAHPAALATDFSEASGTFFIGTPTTPTTDDETSGVWFIDLRGDGGPQAGLSLPELPEGWIYEGWAVIDGIAVTTGRFSDPAMAGLGSPFMFADPPPFPGEDFLVNAPDGLEFPTDLRGSTIAVSVEPNPDDASGPYQVIPLVLNLGSDAPANKNLELGSGPRLPSGVGTLGG